MLGRSSCREAGAAPSSEEQWSWQLLVSRPEHHPASQPSHLSGGSNSPRCQSPVPAPDQLPCSYSNICSGTTPAPAALLPPCLSQNHRDINYSSYIFYMTIASLTGENNKSVSTASQPQIIYTSEQRQALDGNHVTGFLFS